MIPTSLAQRGEQLAADYLKTKGFHIVAHNYRLRIGEIDLICQDDKTLVFVEVKSRRSHRYGDGAEAISLAKQRKIVTVAQVYLGRFADPPPCRFDAVIVDFSAEPPVLRHLEDAF